MHMKRLINDKVMPIFVVLLLSFLLFLFLFCCSLVFFFFAENIFLFYEALRRAFPGAIFYAHDGKGGVAKYDVTRLELAKSPGEHSRATIEPSKKPMKYFASPSLRVNVTPKESWGEKLFELETGGLLILELGMLSFRFASFD